MTEFVEYENEPLLKPSDIARILNVSRSLSYRLLETGEIPTVRINHAVRVKPADLFNFIQKCSQAVAANNID